MLDKNQTAEKLKANLTKAFDAWKKIDPARHTKAEFARQCQTLSGVPCSPQAVGAWFTTGRMDKSWLPIVEQVLGAPLGFGSTVAPATVLAEKRSAAAKWPFRRLDLAKIAALHPDDIKELEGAWRAAARSLNLEIEVAPAGKRKAA